MQKQIIYLALNNILIMTQIMIIKRKRRGIISREALFEKVSTKLENISSIVL